MHSSVEIYTGKHARTHTHIHICIVHTQVRVHVCVHVNSCKVIDELQILFI